MNQKHINLLSGSFRRNQLIRLRVRQWSVVLSAVLVLICIHAWTQFSAVRMASIRLASLQREYEPIQKLSDDADSLEARIDELRRHETLVLDLADEQPMLQLLGLLSRAAQTCDGRLSIQSLKLQDGDPQTSYRILRLDGIALDNHAVARFAAALRQADAFERVELKSTGPAKKNLVDARTYSLECVFF